MLFANKNRALQAQSERKRVWISLPSGFLSVSSYVPGRHQEMLEVQKLFAGDVQSISWLPSPDGRTSLMFVRSSGAGKNLKVYAFKGASGFLEQESLHVDGTVPFNGVIVLLTLFCLAMFTNTFTRQISHNH